MQAATEQPGSKADIDRLSAILSAIIRDAFDSKERLGSMVKNSPAVATKAHISIIEQITGHELRVRMKECEQWDGFANRFFWACAKRTQIMSEPPDLNDAGQGGELSQLIETTQRAKGVGEMERDEDARSLVTQPTFLSREGRRAFAGAA